MFSSRSLAPADPQRRGCLWSECSN